MIGRPRLASALGSLSTWLFLLALVPWECDRLFRERQTTAMVVPGAVGMLLLVALTRFRDRLEPRFPSTIAVGWGVVVGAMIAVDLTELDFRAECICLHGSHVGLYVLAGTVGAIVGGVLAWAGPGTAARTRVAIERRDLQVLSKSLFGYVVWALFAALFAAAVDEVATALVLVGIATTLLFVAWRARRRRVELVRAVLAGEVDGWTLDDDGSLKLALPPAVPYREAREYAVVARVLGAARRKRDLRAILA